MWYNVVMDLKYNDNKSRYLKDHPNAFDSLVRKPVAKPKLQPRQPRKPINPHGQDPVPGLLTIREVASFLRVSPLTVKRWEQRGQMKSIRINSRGDRRYTRDEIDRILGTH